MKRITFLTITSLLMAVCSFAQDGFWKKNATAPTNFMYNDNGGTLGIGDTEAIEAYSWGFYQLAIGGNTLHAGGKFESYGLNSNNTLNTNSRFVVEHGNDFTRIGSGRIHLFYSQVSIGGHMNEPSEYLLTVNGKMRAKELRLEANEWPDYVFSNSYKIAPLYEVETYINENKHLPGVPAASIIEKEGLDVSDMVKIQMEKIEELTLYLIELKKENDALKSKVNILMSQLNKD